MLNLRLALATSPLRGSCHCIGHVVELDNPLASFSASLNPVNDK
jgi:hypothetical protein